VRSRLDEPLNTEVAEPPDDLGGYSSALLDALMRLSGGLMGVLGIGGYIFWALNGGLVREGSWIGVDFHVYYQAAQALQRGGDIYSPSISPPYVYPPLLAALVIPLAALPVDAATILWKLLQHICLLAAGALLVNMVPARIRPLAVGVLLLGALTVPLQDEIRVGESNSLVLVLIAAALWLISRGLTNDSNFLTFQRSNVLTLAAGALLALATSIKVLPAVLVAYLWWRGPRSVAAVATGGFLLLQVLLVLLTPSTLEYWLVQFPGLFGQAFPFLDNQSLNALLSRALTPASDPGMPPMQIAPGEAIRPALTWLANAVVLAVTIWVLWVAGKRSAADHNTRAVRLLLEAGLVLLTIHLVSGSTWLHHLIDLSIPILGLLGAWWLTVGREAEPGATFAGRRTLLLAALLGGGLAVLLHRPSDWVLALNSVAPGKPLLALIAGSAAMWVVPTLWLAIATTLLRTATNKL
jgi:hypothetical protein